MNKFFEQANINFDIEKIKDKIQLIEDYYKVQISEITPELSSELFEFVRDLTIEYINQIAEKPVRKEDLFIENLKDDYYDALFNPIENVIMYDREKIERFINEGDFSDVLFTFLHEGTHYLQCEEKYEETFAESMTKAAEPPNHMLNMYNEAVEKVVVPFLNKFQEVNYSVDFHKFWFKNIFSENKYNEFVARFYLSNFSDLKVYKNDYQLVPSNIAYRKVYYEKEADAMAGILHGKLINFLLGLMKDKFAKLNLLSDLKNKESHLSDYRSFERKIMNSNANFILAIQRLPAQELLNLVIELQKNDYHAVVEYFIANYYSQDNEKNLNKFEKISKNNLQAHLIAKSFSDDTRAVLQCLKKALEKKDYNAICAQEIIFMLMESGTTEQIDSALNIYVENLDLNALFFFYEFNNKKFLTIREQLFSEENQNKYSAVFIQNFIKKLYEIKESNSAIEKLKITTKISEPKALEEIIKWLDISKEEKVQIVAQINDVMKHVMEVNSKKSTESQPGDE